MPGFELVGEEERKAVNELFDDGGVLFAHGFDNIRNNRYHVREFEEEFAKYHNRNFALMTPNCTSSLHLLLEGLGIGENDEVIAPECTWIGSVACITYQNAKTVFADIDFLELSFQYCWP